MDAKQFDSIARALAGQASRRVLAGGQSRRGTLKQLLRGAVGIPAVAIGGMSLSEAEAKKHKKKRQEEKEEGHALPERADDHG